VVLEKEQKPKAVTVYAESTPNPAVMKFVANTLLVSQPYEFKNIDEAKNAPLAAKLFNFPFVKEVFLDENYVSISKYEVADWNEVTLELREMIREYLVQGLPVVDQVAQEAHEVAGKPIEETAKDLDPISQRIVSILDEYVKPAVASDGGNIRFESYDKQTKQVQVVLQGACSGCPSSTFTLKNGIENMLKEMMGDTIGEVVAING
jgi:Fe-S cluster biogenesis protein NfuA